MSLRNALLTRAAKFARDENGNGTIEFVFLFPWFIFIMMMAIEAGMTSARYAMLERGLEQSVRAVRINTSSPPDYNQLKTMICQQSAVFPSCMTRLRLEMVEIDPRVGVNLTAQASCNDDPEVVQPARGFANVGDNRLMLLRACVLVKQIFVVNGVGLKLKEVKNNHYALVASTVFASEPS